MFNCYVVLLNGKQLAVFRTEYAADNFCAMWNATRYPAAQFEIIGKYIEGIGF